MRFVRLIAIALASSAALIGVAGYAQYAQSGGPADQGSPQPQQLGNAQLGRDVFRNETFGNEGFWTDAVRLPQGIVAAKVTPMQALGLGLQIDADAVDAATKAKLAAELKADPSGRTSSLLNDPAVTVALLKAGAVIGVAPKGEKFGVTCALCHTMTDASVFKLSKGGGTIGSRIDGLANNDLNVGKIFATAANTRALYTVAQTAGKDGKTLGRAPTGLTDRSSEADFDAYFGNPKFYPIGMFDDTFDGNGDPMHNSALFRQDLAAPYGSEGTFTKIDDFSNLVYTSLFDQTMLTTPGGRAFVHKLAGAGGDAMIESYVKILRATNVTGYPYVTPATNGPAGEFSTPIGVRVDNRKLLAMNAYLAALPAPAGKFADGAAIARGRATFVASGCTGCHNTDQSRAVPTTIHAMAEVFPGDRPMILAQRDPPLNPVMNTAGNIFDDKWAIVNASLRGEKRGVAMPLLLDLARRPSFLHDSSVPNLDRLLDPARGAKAPHPFYVRGRIERGDLALYLNALDTTSR